MAESSSSAIPEAAKATSTANPPVQDSQITMEMEGDRAEVMGDRMVRAIGGGSPETPPSQFTGVLRSSSQVGMLRGLQRSYGNSYVGRVIQAKLTVGQPGDVYEQEADRVADTVMRMSEPTVSGVLTHSNSIQPMPIQRMCTECAKEEEEKIHPKKSPGQTPTVTPALEARLDGTRGGGEPLPDSVRSYMEPRFGAEFSGVRVHRGSEADALNRELGAQAFTWQRDIYFGAGRYSPETRDGQRLLAHELTHVVQQTGTVQRQCDPSISSCPPEEKSADMTSADAPMSVQAPEGPNASFPSQVESPSSAGMTSTDASMSVPVSSGLSGRDLQPPGNCIQGIHDGMQRSVKAWCDHFSGRTCRSADSCGRLLQKIRRNERCAFFRREINNRCYNGGNLGHRIAERDARNAQKNCVAFLNSKCRQQFLPQPERQPEPAPQRYSQRFDQSFLDRMAAITGLTGAALIAYLIISEGSRLFPPRNLIPVP
jgi:hypothetical protein